MRSLLLFVLLATTALSFGCSDDNSPVAPAPATGSSYELRPVYYSVAGTVDGTPPVEHVTSSHLLTVRFRDGVSAWQQAALVKKYDLTVIFTTQSYRQTLVETDDAFTVARELGRESRIVEYVGPVFDAGTCNGTPLYQMTTNWLIVRGDLQNGEVVAALTAAHATLVEERQRPDDPTRSVYELPWSDPGVLFDLGISLSARPDILYAEPNLMGGYCLYTTTSSTTPPREGGVPR